MNVMLSALGRLSLWQVALIAVAWACVALALPWMVAFGYLVLKSLTDDSRLAAYGVGYTRAFMAMVMGVPIAALFAAWWLARR